MTYIDDARLAIAEIERIEERLREARADRDKAVRSAHLDGMPRPEIARQTGLSVSHVNLVVRWVPADR